MTLAKKDVQSSLLKKGFHQSEGDHIFFHYQRLNGTKTKIKTKYSHGKPNYIGLVLIQKMSQQCKLNKDDFVLMISCSIDQAKYESILIEKGILTK